MQTIYSYVKFFGISYGLLLAVLFYYNSRSMIFMFWNLKELIFVLGIALFFSLKLDFLSKRIYTLEKEIKRIDKDYIDYVDAFVELEIKVEDAIDVDIKSLKERLYDIETKPIEVNEEDIEVIVKNNTQNIIDNNNKWVETNFKFIEGVFKKMESKIQKIEDVIVRIQRGEYGYINVWNEREDL